MLKFPRKAPEKIPWTLTKTGRAVCSSCIAVASTGTVVGYFLLNGYFMDKYTEIVQMYSNGKPKLVHPEVQKTAEEALKKCVVLEREKNVKFFTVHGLNLFSAGSSYLRWGTAVGIPANFAYKKVGDVEKGSLQLNNFSSIDWSSEAGDQLLNSLVLSEQAQKFAIAREIFSCKTYYVYAQVAASMGSIFSAYLLSYRTNRFANLFARPRWMRIIVYGLSSMIGLVMFMAFRDGTNIYYDRVSDEKAANLDLEYLQGGIEFYEKILNKNRALRVLMGKDGEKLYTAMGNEEVFICDHRLPYTTRLDFLKEKLEKCQNSKESNS